MGFERQCGAELSAHHAVRDEINVLPLSEFDDELRVRTAMAIYRDPALQKYSLDPQAPIRIVVENGNVKLYGVGIARWASRLPRCGRVR